METDKQNKLTAGDNITIENDVISASGGSGWQLVTEMLSTDYLEGVYNDKKITVKQDLRFTCFFYDRDGDRPGICRFEVPKGVYTFGSYSGPTFAGWYAPKISSDSTSMRAVYQFTPSLYNGYHVASGTTRVMLRIAWVAYTTTQYIALDIQDPEKYTYWQFLEYPDTISFSLIDSKNANQPTYNALIAFYVERM